jgi:TolA-binding protein
MNKRIVFLILLGLLVPMNVSAQSVVGDSVSASNASALLTRQQQRMDILEQGLKEIRGVIEIDLREIKLKVEQLGSSSALSGTAQGAELNSLRTEMEKLSDMLAMTNRRMERTLEITSDTEFRLLRLENRVQTLISLGGDAVASAAAQLETSAADAPPKVKMNRDSNSGATKWSIEEQALNAELKNIDAEKEPLEERSASSIADAGSDQTLSSLESLSETVTDDDKSTNLSPMPTEPEVLPAVSPEDQYRFALGRALQNDLETAERAFAEFRAFHTNHERQADATFWLGRVQFMRGEYEKAAMTFSEFNSAYPSDKRLVDTTMWIAESVSHFAPQEQACEIYASLPKLLDSPPDSFMTQLSALSDAAKCNI